jgi:hypothetical protein
MSRPDDGMIHFTNLSKFALSPAHYKASFATESTRSMQRGSLVHAVLLEQFTGVVWAGKRTTNEWKAFAAANAEKWIVTQSEMDEANRMSDAVKANPIARPLLEGLREFDFIWEIDGRKCKGTMDVNGGTFINEIKTTRCAHPEWFQREALRRKYHAQAAWYLDGLEMHDPQRGVPRHHTTACYITAVESTAPFAVTVFKLTDRVLDDGRARYRSWWEQLRVCEASDEWPGYAQSVIDFDIAESVGWDDDGES